MRSPAGWTVLFLCVALGSASACYPAIHSTLKGELTPELRAQLWTDPGTGRDLFWGVGGQRLAPDADARYQVIDIKQGGFSRGLTVRGPRDREWSAKFPPEAPTEVVASRILWGVGYHQPPIYYVGEWKAEGAPNPNPQLPARFREKRPDLHRLDEGEHWSYYQNPFVGTPESNGLLVLQVMLGNSDLKADQNVIYHLSEPLEGARTWYVARDLGQSFGRTGVFNAPRGDVAVFEETPFITGMTGAYVRFDYRGRHAPLIDHMTPQDVRWICSRLDRLSDDQWSDAFRAGGYAKPVADRFIRRMKQKIKEGLALSNAQFPTPNAHTPTPNVHLASFADLGVGSWDLGLGSWALGVGSWATDVQSAQAEAALQPPRNTSSEAPPRLQDELVRLPLAAALGAVLAFRPRRRGTPPRQPAVIQTQIILAIVGAVVMMVVGSNLARAFGVVGAAGLVRYRAKIEDPKDAGVMLSTLAVGLAAGVGLFGMAAFAAGFILAVLWAIESFEPQRGKRFEVSIKAGPNTDGRRADIERIFRRYDVEFELRTTSDEEVCYDVAVPFALHTDRVSNAITKLDPEGHTAVEWTEKKKAK